MGDDSEVWDELLDFDEDEFFQAWQQAESEAVELLRRSLPEVMQQASPQSLETAAGRLRAGAKARRWPHVHMFSAAGFRQETPQDYREFWLGMVGGLITMREESGMDHQEESVLMSIEMADWLGAVVGLVRAGPGASAEPEALIGYANDCPEVEGEVDPEEEDLVAVAFELILPAWQAAEAVDAHRSLTTLGWWGLPHALEWAWT